MGQVQSPHIEVDICTKADKANAAMFKSTWYNHVGTKYHHSCYACGTGIDVFDSKLLKIDPTITWSNSNSAFSCRRCARKARRHGLGTLRANIRRGTVLLREQQTTANKHIPASGGSQPYKHPLNEVENTKRKRFGRMERHTIWERECGRRFFAPCCCCGVQINAFDWHVAHKTSLAKGGSNCPDNLTATCSTCNLSMGTMSLEDFRRVSGYTADSKFFCVLV